MNTIIDYIGGRGKTPLSLIFLFVFGCIFWLPSGAINLRSQEMLFPLVGIALYLALNIFSRVSKAVGCLLAFVIVYTLCTFTPDAYHFLMMVLVFAYFYQAIALNYEEIIKHRTLISNLLCGFTLLNVLWLILQANGIHIFFKPKIGISINTGFFSNSNEVSVFLAACLPFFFRRWWHLGIIPVFAGLVLAQTTNGLIGAVIVMALYGLILGNKKGYSKKWLIIGAIVLSVASVSAYMAFVHSGAVNERAAAFSKASELIKEKPLLGWGINQGKFVIPLYLNGDRQDPHYVAQAYGRVLYQEEFKRAYLANPVRYTGDGHKWSALHNEYLQWTIDTGIAGLIGLLLVIASHAIAFFRARRRDLLTGLSVLCLLWTANAFFTFQIGRFSFLAVFFLALIQGAYLTQRRASK
ncbi:MAG: O-antigen ligase family protein [Syntrophorhabdaceae bacterium]